MGGASIQAKIKKGLAKAVAATGSASSELVYLVKKTNSSGSTPLDTITVTQTRTLLTNAIFKNYDMNMIGGSILTGDRLLVCDGDTKILAGDEIEQGSSFFKVVSVSEIAPTSEVLSYSVQVRSK